MNEKQMIYNELCKVLTDFEDGYADEKDLYNMLCTIQNRWEDTITANVI